MDLDDIILSPFPGSFEPDLGLGSGRPGFGFGLPRQAPDLTF